MIRSIVALFVLIAWAGAAGAATISVTPDKATYHVGETITLSIVGDPQGAAAVVASGFLRYDESLVDWQSTNQQPLTSLGFPWTIGGAGRNCLVGNRANPGCPAFDQINFAVAPNAPVPADNLLLSTMLLTAIAPGTVDFSWETDPITGWQFNFFGLTNGPGASVTIVNPEPGTAALLALGLLQLAASRGSMRRK